MSKQIFLVCEKDVAGNESRRKLAQIMREYRIEYRVLPVSQRIIKERPAVSNEIFLKTAWLCFSTPDAVNLFLRYFDAAVLKNAPLKIAVQDLNTAVTLVRHGLHADYIPIKPLHLQHDGFFAETVSRVVSVDGQEWPSFKAAVNITLTEMKALSCELPEEGVFLLNTPREAMYLLQQKIHKGIFLCKNPSTAEECWQRSCEKVVLPADFTYEGMLEKLKEIITC